MAELVIQTEGLTKTYRDWFRKTPALSGVSLEIEQGSIFGLLGQNGAGKTTLVKILLGLTHPNQGKSSVLGGSPQDPKVRRRIGYLPEQMILHPYFRPTGFLRYMGRMNGVSPSVLKTRVPELLEQVGLGGVKKKLGAFSKGMRQRLGLAQALLNEPSLLVLDEPTEGLDPLGRKEIRDLLLLARQQGTTVFLNSHILSEVELICDQVLILHKGEVVSGGTPDEFRKATGEYRLRLAETNSAIIGCVDEAMPGAVWDGNNVLIRPQSRADVNGLIDKLRALPVELESLEPIRSSLEQFFIEVVAEEEPL